MDSKVKTKSQIVYEKRVKDLIERSIPGALKAWGLQIDVNDLDIKDAVEELAHCIAARELFGPLPLEKII